MRTAVQEGGRGRQASGGSPAALCGGGTAGEDKRMGAVRPFSFPHRCKAFAERLRYRQGGPSLSCTGGRRPSGRLFCRAIFSLQTKRCGRSLRGRDFRTLRGGLCRLPDRRRAVWGSRTERGPVCRTIFRRRRGFRRAKAVECKMASGIDMLAAIGCAVVVLAVVTGVKYLCRRYGAGRRSPRGRA